MDALRTVSRMRLMAGLITLFVMGAVEVELFLLQHIEEWRQILPLAVIGAAAIVLVWQMIRPSVAGIMTLRVLMIALVATGVLGVYFHYQGNLEFQLEMDPAQRGWALMMNVLEAKTPPALAPGSLAQIGLLGLLYTYRHPSLE
jgi:hypothetical protein